MSPTLFPSGFRISTKPVAASFAHPNSFQLLPPDTIRDESTIDATVALGGRAEGYAKYWDDGTALGELVFEVEEADVVAASKSKGKEKEKKKERSKDSKSALIFPCCPAAVSDDEMGEQ